MSVRLGSTGEMRTNLFRRGDGDEQPDGLESLIDSSSSIDGLFKVGNHLRIEGQAKGEIHCEGVITIAETAQVSAKITANSVVVAGQLDGEVTCRERLQILPTGRVSGTITTASLVIQEGAFYEGQLHMRTAPSESRPQPNAGRSAPAASSNRGRTANGEAT